MTRATVVVGLLAVAAGFGAWTYTSEPEWYAEMRYPLRYESIVRGHAENYRLEPSLVAAVIYQESKFRADARSPSGAGGLMQLLPATAMGIAERTGGSQFEVDDLLDPEINVRYGSWYLRHLLDKYDDLDLALAAYNAGPNAVARYGGIPPYSETRHYVRNITAYAARLRRLGVR